MSIVADVLPFDVCEGDEYSYPRTIVENREQIAARALGEIFSDLSSPYLLSDLTLQSALSLQANHVPFSTQLTERVAEAVQASLRTGETLLPSTFSETNRKEIFNTAVKVMGYGNIPVDLAQVEATACALGQNMESVRLSLVPGPKDLWDIARQEARQLTFRERTELSANARRMLIRCGGGRYFNELIIKLYDPRALADSFVRGLARSTYLLAETE